MPTNETVPVVQGSRDAAAEYVELAFGRQYKALVLRDGGWPDLVQAFARYRLSVIEECAGVCDTYVTRHSDSDTGQAMTTATRRRLFAVLMVAAMVAGFAGMPGFDM